MLIPVMTSAMLKFIFRRRWQGLVAPVSLIIFFSLLSNLRSRLYSIPSIRPSSDNVETCDAFPAQVFQKKRIQVLLKNGIGIPTKIRTHFATVVLRAAEQIY